MPMERRDFVTSLAVGAGALGLRADSLFDAVAAPPRGTFSLDRDWRFARAAADAAAAGAFDDSAWESVTLPHTARVEALVTGAPGSDTAQW